MKIGLKILGCPKNEADCDVLEGILKSRGHQIVKNVDEAQVIIIDTCGFIESAKRESIEEILDFVNYKKKHNFFLCVKGCLVQRYPDQLRSEIPEVDAWYGVLSPSQIADAIEKKVPFLVTQPQTIYDDTTRTCKGSFAYVKIADGCNRSCTFCAIPSFKGDFKSRSIEIIEAEVNNLVKNGVKEVILVAQDTTAYGIDLYGKPSLDVLLKKLNSLDGEFRIRVLYLHPDHIDEKVIEAILSYEKVLPYFDMPVQHGSDRILKKMGRSRTSSELLELIEQIRNMNQDAAIRTSIIVGFPGETDEDFEKLMNFLKKARFDRLGSFIYSDEEGTVASSLKEKVPAHISQERYEELLVFQSQISYERLERFVGRTLSILIEECQKNKYVGRSHLDTPEIDGNVFINSTRKIRIPDYYMVQITSVTEYDMEGVLV
ncbi:30S ribosomal protein S12 methylthiotransferase RimO [Thermotoga profunda]|uniref:30S ribosomal protein S12 methylthiotransferase RimO n=1 Tax=Thermotoga profunda TaxID=1508420 RepID=UPI0005974C9F|nr:30S ribosomal protein S12 methylthiotransferase RimO [Thermotoga profunda]